MTSFPPALGDYRLSAVARKNKGAGKDCVIPTLNRGRFLFTTNRGGPPPAPSAALVCPAGFLQAESTTRLAGRLSRYPTHLIPGAVRRVMSSYALGMSMIKAWNDGRDRELPQPHPTTSISPGSLRWSGAGVGVTLTPAD